MDGFSFLELDWSAQDGARRPCRHHSLCSCRHASVPAGDGGLAINSELATFIS